jgi:hypothetical protein
VVPAVVGVQTIDGLSAPSEHGLDQPATGTILIGRVVRRHGASTAFPALAGRDLTKPKKVTPRKNDACVAMVMAVAMAMQEAPEACVRTPRLPVGF